MPVGQEFFAAKNLQAVSGMKYFILKIPAKKKEKKPQPPPAPPSGAGARGQWNCP